VFLDEFSSALDHEKKEQYIKFIKKFCEDNSITIVLISHDIEEIMALTEKIIILRKGKLLKKMNLPQGEKGIAMIKSFK
jgi:ABC-type multidrug transport system ATPase subunit